ncbi:MAG TPA: cystathionine gamma-lyase [Gemmatimonadales bacterium]|nr:cystathionine gamma-lyase [Gemmatimonadales bacterium]
MHRDTLILQAGLPDHRAPGAFLPGPQFASTFVSPGDPAAHQYTYGRFNNPTWNAWEAALEVLEGGPALAFPSGMAATAAIFGVTLKPGDVVVLPAEAYYTTRTFAQTWLAGYGITVRLAPTRGEGQASALAGARLLWIETPTNPGLEICDLEKLIGLARAAGVLTAVDNTTATAALQQPLALGATFSLASDTKALTGHSDLLLGHVATRDAEWMMRLRTWRTQYGVIPGPMEVWLAHRSLGTLPLRLARQCANAEALARQLDARPDVRGVLYPGLPGHPGHAVATRQMSAFGGVLSFDLETRSRAERFLQALELVRETTSFGGIHSTAERRARWGGDPVSEGFIRFSAGCEATEDLVADVLQALDRARA